MDMLVWKHCENFDVIV